MHYRRTPRWASAILAIPFRMRVGVFLRPGENTLESVAFRGRSPLGSESLPSPRLPTKTDWGQPVRMRISSPVSAARRCKGSAS